MSMFKRLAAKTAGSATLSDEQAAFVEAGKVAKPGTALALNSKAGTGKTFVQERLALELPDKKILYLVFNAKNRAEAQSRMPRNVEVHTFHSYCASLLRASGRYPYDVTVSKTYDVLKHPERGVRDVRARWPIAQGVSLAKNLGLGVLIDDTPEAWEAIYTDYDIKVSKHVSKHALIGHARRVFGIVTSDRRKIDFDDQLYFAASDDAIQPPVWDVVMVDEAQDVNPAQIAVLDKLMANGHTQMVFVGDEHQCIPRGQSVGTPNGYRPIEEIQVGDLVWSSVGGRRVARAVTRVGRSTHAEAIEFTTETGRTFQATDNHVLFSCIGPPDGWYVYMMWRSGYGFRVGSTQTTGTKAEASFKARTQQEGAERMWILGYYETSREAIRAEHNFAYLYGIPMDPFVERGDFEKFPEPEQAAWFRQFEGRGYDLLGACHLDFERPAYFAKSSGRGVVTVNCSLAGDTSSEVALDSALIPESVASRWGFVPTGKGTMRLRRWIADAATALDTAQRLVADLQSAGVRAFVSERLAGYGRRVFATRAAGVFPGMLVPEYDALADEMRLVKIASRKTVQIPGECFDLEIDRSANFFVGGVCVHNSIYGFRGAGVHAFSTLIERYNAEVLDLTRSRRCPRAVIREAQRLVPDINHLPDAPEGIVRRIDPSDFDVRILEPGDAVLCRNNAPLLKTALECLDAGVPCTILGRDLIKSITYQTEAAFRGGRLGLDQGALAFQALRVKVREDLQDRPFALAEALEEIDCADAVYRNLQKVEPFPAHLSDLISEAATLCARLFSDEQSRGKVTFATAHRSKGLEWNRIYAIRPDLLPSRSARKSGDWQLEQEGNLAYVLITRAKQELVWVSTAEDPLAQIIRGLRGEDFEENLPTMQDPNTGAIHVGSDAPFLGSMDAGGNWVEPASGRSPAVVRRAKVDVGYGTY